MGVCYVSTWATSGTYTLFFTDIEGSTRRWGENPAAMRVLLEQHDRILRETIATHHGHVFKTIGDAFCAAFVSAQDALLAAVDAQLAFTGLTVSAEIPIRVRIALHTGEVEARDDDFFGPPVNRVARLLAITHGGQILVTQATYALVRDHAPAQVTFYDLGLHRLRDIARPEQIHQVNPPGLSGSFPPLRTDTFTPGNIQSQVTTFVGREHELREITDLLGQTRLLTLIGIGGTGKTRLAVQLAELLASDYADGAWFIDLAPITEGALVAQTLAITLGISLEGHRQALPEIVAFIRSKRLLLVLDNCEHLVDACAELTSTLLNAGAGVTILATSRETLRVPGETIYRLLPLTCPIPDDATPSPDALMQYEAVRLFLDRAIAVQPGFIITANNAAIVSQLCINLDGLPLAIELATARLRVMTVEQIVARLGDRFRLLAGGARSVLPRQQTLRALIDWSYDLLDVSEQALLRRLTVFAGGWTLEAAEDVCADDIVESWEILDLLTGLVDKSLVLSDPTDAGMRFRMLEVVRQYCNEKLRDAGETDTFQTRHAGHFLAQVAREKREIAGAASSDIWAHWAAYNVAEMDNFRTALRHDSVGLDGFPLALTFFRRLPQECHSWLDVLLTRNIDAQTMERAEALLWAAHVCRTHAEARPYVEESLVIFRQLRHTASICECLRTLSRHAVARGDLVEAERLSAECRREAGDGADYDAAVHACIAAAVIELALGHVDAARPCLEQALAIRRKMQLPQEVAFILFHLGTAEYLTGHFDRARELAMESNQLFQETGNPSYTPPLRLLGDIARAQGCYHEALTYYRASILDHWRQVDSHTSILLLERFGYTDAAMGSLDRAVRWLAAADHLRQRDGYPRMPVEVREWEREITVLRKTLHDTIFQAAWDACHTDYHTDLLGTVLTETQTAGTEMDCA